MKAFRDVGQETSLETIAFHNVGQQTLFETNAFRDVGQETSQPHWERWGIFNVGAVVVVEHGLYFGKAEFYDFIRKTGGEWADSKERPLVCMMKSLEYKDIYWAIPIGNWNHRDQAGKDRINRYLALPQEDLRSCYYHVGNTDVKSIFFISDAVPITTEYVEREYVNRYTGQIYIIQNKPLIVEIERKLKRILAFEKKRNNYFRQHITDLVEELTNRL